MKYVVFSLLILWSSLYAQINQEKTLMMKSAVLTNKFLSGSVPVNKSIQNEKTKDNVRFNIYTSLGIYEMLLIGLGYNIDEDWGMALKGNVFLLRGSTFFNAAYGYGIKVHKRLYKGNKFRLFDTVNLEACVGSNLFMGERTLYKDIQFDLSSEKPFNLGISFFYSFGVGYSTNEEGGYLLMPVLKCGSIIKL